MIPPIWSKQPFKSAYLVFLIVKILATLLLSVRYTFQTSRHVRKWTYKACLVREMLCAYFDFLCATRSNGLSTVIKGHADAKERFASAPPGDASLYTGVLSSNKIRPAETGGIWYPSHPASDGKLLSHSKVVIHSPGGAFVLAFGHDNFGRDIADIFQQYVGASYVFYPQYRLAQSAETCFPAAVQDMLTVYKYVLDLGFEPSNIVISGDSAAANLNIALIRHLETSAVLPLPAAILSWSPWVHVTAKAGKEYGGTPNSRSDVLVGQLLEWGAEAYIPAGGPSPEELPYISPLHHPFKTRVPFFLQAGTAEVFHDSIRDFADEMVETNGERLVQFQSTEFAPHNLLMCHKGMDMLPEMKLAGDKARRFLGW
jgi:acetyl esterase/lipase